MVNKGVSKTCKSKQKTFLKACQPPLTQNTDVFLFFVAAGHHPHQPSQDVVAVTFLLLRRTTTTTTTTTVATVATGRSRTFGQDFLQRTELHEQLFELFELGFRHDLPHRDQPPSFVRGGDVSAGPSFSFLLHGGSHGVVWQCMGTATVVGGGGGVSAAAAVIGGIGGTGVAAAAAAAAAAADTFQPGQFFLLPLFSESSFVLQPYYIVVLHTWQ